MKYLIVQQWDNTKGNHAGMEHMCDLLVSLFPAKYYKISKKGSISIPQRRNRLFQKIFGVYNKYIEKRKWNVDYMQICLPMFEKMKAGDEVFLLEYNWPATSQYELACYIRKKYPKVRIYALSHITPTLFSRQKHIREQLIKWDKPVDRQLTLGSSLSNYFYEKGICQDKISTGFHYVDLSYYHTDSVHTTSKKPLTVIAMGFLQRDYSLLASIVNRVSNVNWIICRGRNSRVDEMFKNAPNVTMKGFMEEDELRHMMEISDISLNVLEDTVGSNVITTSLAMGLAIVASNVGSIGDYCDSSNSILCNNNEDSFVKALTVLISDSIRLHNMRISSIKKAQDLRIEKVDEWFSNLG